MLTEALEYPRSSDDWLKTVFFGGVFVFFGWLIVPAVLVAGYLVRVLRGSMAGDETPPEFTDWSDLFSDGLRAAAIVIGYSLLPAVVVTVAAIIGGAIASAGTDAAVGLGTIVLLLGSLLGALLGLAAAYLIPAGVANYAETDRLAAGFSWSDLRPVLFSGTYATAWLVGAAIVVGAVIVLTALNIVPVIGSLVAVLLGPFVTFFAEVAAFFVIGRAWAEMHPIETETTDSPGQSPAV